MPRVYIGIDLSAKWCWAAARDEQGRLICTERFSTSAENLIAYVRARKGRATVLLEECDLAGWAQRVLLPHAEKVAICEPRSNLWIHRDAVKSDRIDAAKLAQIARQGNFKEVWHPQDEGIRRLERAVRAYERAVRRVVTQKNQVKASLRREGVICRGSRVYGARGREEALSRVEDPAIRRVLAGEFDLLDALTAHQARARRTMVELAGEIPAVRAIREIPGFGPVGAARFCAYIGCPHRFPDKRRLWSYCGLGVSRRETGGRPVGREHLDRGGCRPLKDVSRTVYQGAMRCRGDNLLKRSYERTLKGTGNELHARLTIQRKAVAIAWSMWRCGTAYDDNADLKRRGARRSRSRGERGGAARG